MITRYALNTVGTDYAIGDIHGCFEHVFLKLHAIGFDRDKDRLFSVGDLVDRGWQSNHALKWIKFPWFIPVRGNHDDYVCRMDTCDALDWHRNGGAWFQSLDPQRQLKFQEVFRTLPLAIEVETQAGHIGIVHADPYFEDWQQVRDNVDNKRVKDRFMWSRARVENNVTTVVRNIDHVVCGHNPLPAPLVLGNVHYIDTRGWHPFGYFTILNLNTMQPV